jgi:hypothetical protein
VDKKKKPFKNDGGAPGGSRDEGAAHHPMWVELHIRRRQSNSATTDDETGSKLIEH